MPCWKQVVGKLLSNLITATVIYNIVESLRLFFKLFFSIILFKLYLRDVCFSFSSLFLIKQCHFKNKTW